MGPQACAPCHPSQFKTQSQSHHALALRRINETPMAAALNGRSLTDRSGVRFTYSAAPAGINASAARDGESGQLLLEWAFGYGAKAITAVGRSGDRYIEHRVSWYREGDKLGLTPGHPARLSGNIDDAQGVYQSDRDANRCFQCHTTNITDARQLDSMIAGVTCERCHGPGSDHVAAAKAGTDPKRLINSLKLRAADSVAFCAQCHRSPNGEFKSQMPELDDPISVRFAPVGFTASKCFQKSQNFSCVTCHNPHANPKPASDTSYTAVCRNCHQAAVKVRSHCPRATRSDCVTCHMPKSTPLANLTFTDHRIR